MTPATLNQIKELSELHGLSPAEIANGMKLELSAVESALASAAAVAKLKERASDERGHIAHNFDPFLDSAIESIVELSQCADCDSVRLKANLFIAEMCNGTLAPKKAETTVNNIGTINSLITQGMSAYRKNLDIMELSDNGNVALIPIVSEKVA